MTLLAALVTLWALLVGYRNWRTLAVGVEAGGGAPGRSGYMALAGVLLNGIFLFTILLG